MHEWDKDVPTRSFLGRVAQAFALGVLVSLVAHRTFGSDSFGAKLGAVVLVALSVRWLTWPTDPDHRELKARG